MITDPVIGSFVWVTSSLAFLAASTALVRLLDARTPRPRHRPGPRRAGGPGAGQRVRP